MSLSTSTCEVFATGNGAAHVYPYTFRIQSQSHLQVVVRDTSDVETILTLTTHYTVSGVGEGSGGNVTLVNGGFAWQDSDGDLLSGYVLIIRRIVPLTQGTSFRNQDDFYPESHEDALDKLTMIDQQQQREIDRAPRLPATIDPDDVDMELPVPSAGLALGWNEDEDGLTNLANVGDLSVSAFGESLLNALNAAAGRSLLDVIQAINSLTAETDPAVADLIALYDASAAAYRKMTLSNLLKVVSLLTEDTDPAVADALLTYDASATSNKQILFPMLPYGARTKGWFSNLGLAAAQSSVAADSIKIQGAIAALSATNPLSIIMPGATAGLLASLRATADVTLNLTGAHWGLGTKGDFSNVELRVYAINDAGTLKWGVSLQGGLRTITTANSSATATNINAKAKMLVSSTLSGTSACQEVGWFHGNFDDTGGSSEDLWVVQTTLGSINVGVPVRDQTNFDEVSWTPTGTWSTNTTYAGKWRRNGHMMQMSVTVTLAGAPTSATFTLNLPSGYQIDTTALEGTTLKRLLGAGWLLDNGTGNYSANVSYASATTIQVHKFDANVLDASTPFTWASGDSFNFMVEVPILQWSAN